MTSIHNMMRAALALGARHLGRVWPNPSVGAIFTRETSEGSFILACGMTQPTGRPHAERFALSHLNPGEARGSTLYVTLEPCSHYGKTPPCVEAVIEAGVSRVVVCVEDPDPRVSGRGLARLREAGIDVVSGVLRQEGLRTHKGHILRVTKNRPAFTVKLARTKEGVSGLINGSRLLITSEIANARVHLMRTHMDALLIGAGTLATDNPKLTVRLPGLASHTPIRIVLEGRSTRLNLSCALLETLADAPVWVVTSRQAETQEDHALISQGVVFLRTGADSKGDVDLTHMAWMFAERGLTRIFCEGGPALANALSQAGLIDDVVLIDSHTSLPETLQDVGLNGVGPHLAAALEQNFRLIREEPLEKETLRYFEREL